VEQTLARELQATSEAVRLAGHALHETGAVSGAVFPDSKVESEQARSAYHRAHEAWLTATERWVAFVKDGTLPDDIGPDDLEL
jgi:hypothetical protein